MTDVPESDEVSRENEIRLEKERKEGEAAHEKLMNEIEQERVAQTTENEQKEAEHLAKNKQDHNERVQAAQAFDWAAWEKETGLQRPEIPAEHS